MDVNMGWDNGACRRVLDARFPSEFTLAVIPRWLMCGYTESATSEISVLGDEGQSGGTTTSFYTHGNARA